MIVYALLGNSQSQAEPLRFLLVFAPVKSLEEVRQSLPVDGRSRISNRDGRGASMASPLQPNDPTWLGILHRIVQQDYDQLPDLLRISLYNEYFLTFGEATGKYADVSVTVSILADATASIVDNRLVVKGSVTTADYIAAVSAATIDGTALRGGGLGAAIFNDDGSINFDAMYGDAAHGDAEVPLFPEGSAGSYELTYMHWALSL